MGYIEGICPLCEEKILIPEDKDTVKCEHCQNEVSSVDALMKVREKEKEQEEEQKKEKNRQFMIENYKEELEFCKKALPNLLLKLQEPLKKFKKNIYPDAFDEYFQENKQLLDRLERTYIISPNKSGMLNELAEYFVSQIKDDVDSAGGKNAKERRLMDCNLVLVTFVLPVILENKGDVSEPLTDTLLLEWSKQFPKTNLKKATYETINSGFRRRFCYITTAVCDSLGKGDDCYELNVLRNYRDGYLMSEPDGESLVQEYYDIAPTIVKHINRQKNRQEIYQTIWKEYLDPCIHLIEEDNKDECKKVYYKMVRDLQKKYFM